MNTYKIIYKPYDRCPMPTLTKHFEAPDDKTAFLIADPFFGYACGAYDPAELEEEDGYWNSPLETLKENLHTCNGDGFDFLFLLKNEDTGEIIFEDGDYNEDN